MDRKGNHRKKIQDKDDKDQNQARFTIRFSDVNRKNYRDLTLILQENFGELGDVVRGTNRTLYTLPQPENTK